MISLLVRAAALLGLSRLTADPAFRARAGTVAAVVGLAAAVLLISLLFWFFSGMLERSPALAVTYAAAIIVVAGAALWHFRPRRAPRRRRSGAQLRRQAAREARGLHVALERSAAEQPPPRAICLMGLAGVGRRSLAAQLRPLVGGLTLSLPQPLGADALENRRRGSQLPTDTTLLYVVTQDLFAYEYELLRRLDEERAPRLVVALNKIDRLSKTAQDEICAAIEAKLAGFRGYAGIARCAAAPQPKVIWRVAANGDEQRIESLAQADIGNLPELLCLPGPVR